MNDEYEAIRESFEKCLSDPTGESDEEFKRLVLDQFSRVFQQEKLAGEQK